MIILECGQKGRQGGGMTNAPSFFSLDYYAARERFLSAATQGGARITSVEHPTAKGPSGRALFMDRAVLGPEGARMVLVVMSATHGPEGYCGSGVQTGLFETRLAQEWATQGLKVVMIHAHNPYGFAWDTRFNEDNIDLNRNYVLDWSAPLPENPGYDVLKDAAAPVDRSQASLDAAQVAMMEYVRDHG
jgi:hypothetical protein